jgi:hypothetical protein
MAGIITFLLCSLLFVSCVAVSTFDIQVLEPATDPLTPDISNVVLLNRTIIDEPADNGVTDTVPSFPSVEFYNKTTTEVIFALADILNESPGIGFIDDSRILETTSEDTIPAFLEPDYVRLICDSLGADAVLSLEVLDFEYSDTLRVISERMGAVITRYYLGEKSINISALWRVYEHNAGRPAHEHAWLDTLLWQHASYYIREIYAFLPSMDEALLEAGYFTAISYARRISPYWILQERTYFARGNRDLRMASNLMVTGRQGEAEEIYEGLLERRNKNIVAAAAYNLALVNELEGDYRQALNWARRSYQVRRHPVMADYIKILEERLETSGVLDRQLGKKP